MRWALVILFAADLILTVAGRIPGEEIPLVNPNAAVVPEDRDNVDVIVRRTRALMDNLSTRYNVGYPRAIHERLAMIRNQPRQQVSGLAKGYSAAAAAAELQRTVAFSNPLLDFDKILFVARNSSWGGYHMCDQYFGFYQSWGGSLYILNDAFGANPRIQDILANSTVTNGRLAGRKLSGNGSFLSPDLSYDATQIAFAWVERNSLVAQWTEQSCFHIFKVNVDGTNLVQLTDGAWNDFDPCWLPNGRIAFISERRGGFGRCHGRPVPTYTLYSMKPDGSDIMCLDYHETNEWHPSVNNDGMIVYSRWDYVDRDSDIAHHIWITYPDGRDPRAPHGNYPLPYTTIGVSGYEDGRKKRPWMELNIRAIPNSHKYVATAAPHHGFAFGSLVMIDTHIEDDGVMSQLKRLTPDNLFPESEGGGEKYGTAWPLSEEYFLCNIDSDIYLLDVFGNKVKLCSSSSVPGGLRLIDPIPLRPRPKPPSLATMTFDGERADHPDHRRAVISVMNVYEADKDAVWPVDRPVKWLRVVQLFPKTTPNEDIPRIGFARQGIARMSLGIVPVEDDGSAYFEAPVGKAIYFQALDENRMAVQSMRSVTCVHPGEHLSCVGCHENKWKAVRLPGIPAALQRVPSKLQPDYGGVEPINFHRLVKPVFTGTCLPCHTSTRQGPQTMIYDWQLDKYTFYFNGGNGNIMNASSGGSRTFPGLYGAAYSRMGKAMLRPNHRPNITDEEFGRVALWLDCMSNELGAYEEVARQQAGELVWPKIDVDPRNLTGVESDYPVPGTQTVVRDLVNRGVILSDRDRVAPRITVHDRMIDVSGLYGHTATFYVHDVAGRCVSRVTLVPAGNSAKVRLHDLRFLPGAYAVSVRCGGRTAAALALHF